MTWPWNKHADQRIEAAERGAAQAEQKLRTIEAQWPRVHEVAGEARLHRELNGWTAAVKTIFGGK